MPRVEISTAGTGERFEDLGSRQEIALSLQEEPAVTISGRMTIYG